MLANMTLALLVEYNGRQVKAINTEPHAWSFIKSNSGHVEVVREVKNPAWTKLGYRYLAMARAYGMESHYLVK